MRKHQRIVRGFLTAILLVATVQLWSQEKPETPLEYVMEELAPRNIGPAGMSGRITCIAVHPNIPTTIFAGAASGGLWRSENNGQTWEPLFENEAVASVGAIAIDPKHPDIIFLGTGEGNPRNSQTSGYGLYKSYDGGDSWELLGLENTRTIHRIIINPENNLWDSKLKDTTWECKGIRAAARRGLGNCLSTARHRNRRFPITSRNGCLLWASTQERLSLLRCRPILMHHWLRVS